MKARKASAGKSVNLYRTTTNDINPNTTGRKRKQLTVRHHFGISETTFSNQLQPLHADIITALYTTTYQSELPFA